jgi:hypothetical protein
MCKYWFKTLGVPLFGRMARLPTGVAAWCVLPDVRREGDVKVAEPLKMNAILVHTARLGHRQEQQVELLD